MGSLMFWLLYPPGANPCYESILNQILEKLCCWCRLIHCVGSCVDCIESLVFVNWLILLDCHYLTKDCPTCSYYTASKMLFCFIFCSKFVQAKRFFIAFKPKCLSDIMFCEIRGTWSRVYKSVYSDITNLCMYHEESGRKCCETKYKPWTEIEYSIWEVSQFINENKHKFQQIAG
jgi:hypothetical protein